MASSPGDARGEAAADVVYNPRPSVRSPQPRVEVEDVGGLLGLTTTRQRVRLVLGTEGASSLSSVFTLCNSAIGAGVLSLPYAFSCAGLVGCMLLCLVVAGLEAFTMYVLSKYAERYGGAASYGLLIRRALGRKTAAGLSAVTLAYLWGSCVAYMVIIADTFTSLSRQHLGPEAWASQRALVLLAAGLLVLVMCFPRDLQALERVSFLAVLGFLYTAAAVLVRGTQTALARPPEERWADVPLFRFDFQALFAISIVVFGFNCHANVVGVFYELEHNPHRLVMPLPARPEDYHALGSLAPKPYTFKLIGMLGVVISAMSIILVGYSCVGVAGFVAYPASVSSNVLNSFPPGDPWIEAAQAIIGCVVLAHWPLNHNPARASWEDLADAVADVKQVPAWASNTVTVLFVASAVATALVVTDLGAVLHLIGGTAASFMIFFLPGLLLMNAAIIKHTSSYASLSQLAGEDEADGAPTGPSSVRSGDGGTPLGRPLLSKKAGLRESGVIFAPGKSWFIGLVLCCISGGVLAVTLFTALVA